MVVSSVHLNLDLSLKKETRSKLEICELQP